MESSLQALTPNTWPVGTEVVLMQVPWQSNYRDIVIWDNIEQRNEYMSSNWGNAKRWTSKKFQYLKPGDPIRVPVPYSACYRYNYLWVQNPMQPVEGEEQPLRLCYFITGVTYISPATTELTLQLDLIQTYQFGMTLGNMFVERGHMAVSNSRFNISLDKLDGQWVHDYLTVPEGMDVGSQYTMANHEWYPLTEPDTNELGKVIITSTANLAADPGTIDSPSLNVADGQTADGIPSACNVYSMSQDTFKSVMLELKDKSWVAQCIISVTTYPSRLLSEGPEVKLFGKGPTIHFLGTTDTFDAGVGRYAESGNIFQQLSAGIPTGYHDFFKAYSYPYSVIELTAYNGNSVFLKPELVNGNKLALYVMGCAVAPFARTGVFVRNYNNNIYDSVPENQYEWVGFDGQTHTGIIPGGDFLDSMLWIADFPQFSIVNSSYLTYMASTAHTRQYQYQSAGWNQAKSIAGAQVSYENAMASANTQQANYDASLQGLANQVAQQAINSPIYESSDGSITTPSIGSIVNPLLQSTVFSGWSGLNQIASNLTGATQVGNNVGLAQQVAGNNLDYANYAAQGDYANQIAAINATVQDAALQPPSTAGQMGGQGFMWKNGLVGFAINYKTACGGALTSICQYWAKYGYKINRFYNFKNQSVKAMRVMSHWSYWKVSEAYLECVNANEAERDAIRGILEKGVTVWHDPEDIGAVDVLDNKPLYNISY